MENVIIIGGGPAGLAAGIYLSRANLNPLIIAGSPPGGQLTLTSDVENYPGYESILGPDLIEKMRNQAKKFGTRIVDENVINVETGHAPSVPKTITSGSGKAYQSKAIIIATGAKALWLNIPSEMRLRGKGVSACATCDGFFFKNKTVAVVGGGDTALEEALTLTKFAEKVYIIHRRGEFRASKIMQDRVLKHPKIEIIFNSAVEEIIGDKHVEGIKIKNVGVERDRPEKEIKLDGVFIAIGHKPDTDLFKDKIELDIKGYIMTSTRKAFQLVESVKTSQSRSAPSAQSAEQDKANFNRFQPISTDFNQFDFDYQSATSVLGVFAAGDCVDHVYKQAATAVGMGVAAALEVEKYLV